MKDPERFKAELDLPLDGSRSVTEEDIEADGAAFMTFAAMMGVKPPTDNADEGVPAALPSS